MPQDTLEFNSCTQKNKVSGTIAETYMNGFSKRITKSHSLIYHESEPTIYIYANKNAFIWVLS